MNIPKNAFVRPEYPESERFHEATKLHRFDCVTPTIPQKLYLALNRTTKEFPGALQINLPAPSALNVDLNQVLNERVSCRDYSTQPISLVELSTLLRFSVGIREERSDGFQFKFVPTAGGLNAHDMFISAINIDGVPQGLYYYSPPGHALIQISDTVSVKRLIEVCTGARSFLASTACVFFLSANLRKMRTKYGERGYRFALLDCGHIAQNISLIATALRLGTCAIGGFLDSEVDQMLGINGVDEANLYALTCGHQNNIHNKDTPCITL